MKRWHAVAAILLAAWGTPAWGSPARVIFLEPGVGLRGRIELGKTVTEDAKQRLDALERDFGLRYKEEGGVVILIDCAKQGCVTGKNVGVGSTRATIYQRYGRPERVPSRDHGEVLKYNGLAFGMDRAGRVVTHVYVFPMR